MRKFLDVLELLGALLVLVGIFGFAWGVIVAVIVGAAAESNAIFWGVGAYAVCLFVTVVSTVAGCIIFDDGKPTRPGSWRCCK